MLLILLASALARIVYGQTSLQVKTTIGIVEGASAPDGNYFTFYGVHYGGDTAGENRFKSPPPPPTYPGPYIANNPTVICAQPSPQGMIGTEDCLRLNIFTNGTTPIKPVLVWLVAEEYTNLNGNPNPSFRPIVSEGVVVVQMNYRLSIFGFLCLGVAEAPGNAGLKDVVQGLKWIKANIAGFGGDPNNVILFGHGSAAAMVDLITMSPSATGLVNKAIAQSGSALSPWAIAYDPVGYARAFANKVGNYKGKSSTDLANFLINANLTALQGALNDFEFYNNTILFAPCIENKDLASNYTFLTDAPVDILQKGGFADIPYIAGYTDKEGTMRAEEAAVGGWLEKMQRNFTWFLPADLNFSNNLTNVERSIREFYFAQRNVNMETIEDFLDYQGDTLVLVSVIRGATMRAATSRSEVRLMEFAYRGTMNSDWQFPNIPISGARHDSIFNYLLDQDLTEVDRPVMTSLIGRFVAFFNTGVPNALRNPGATWSPITNGSLQYLLYSGSDSPDRQMTIYIEEARVNPHTQRMTLWNDIYFKYYVKPQTVSSAPRLFGIALFVFICQNIVVLLS